jgi:hypothetical protein
VYGTLRLPTADIPTRVYVGSFASPVPEGAPASCDVVDGADFYRLPTVPDGEWCIRAAAVAVRDIDPRPWRRRPLFVSRSITVCVRAGSSVQMDIDLHPMGPVDLPILLALPELDNMQLPEQVSAG